MACEVHVARNILIVDDDPIFRAIAVELLSEWFKCFEADDGDTALEYLLKNPVDLLVTDILMPRLGGLDLIKRARSNGIYLPIIAVSGGRPGVDAQLLLDMASALGVRGTITKPINRTAFLTVVVEALQSKSQVQTEGSTQ